ncbi:DNA (cytosine-5-)-methyltransferase [Pseudoalteromonas rubra]|uniref:DNA (cytosine-5-)-methyltransferase n=1 Tax=Pseudoalteromonas rubra TaxID=43658 RepID=A0A4V2E454_9GAMM|nr:DNA cytosine methyltransferase [Pseudoalteromonas rubra]RZM84936.1 DNA (cytosine-5-)-methyltransferase [Pseudoalteromonas rubra]
MDDNCIQAPSHLKAIDFFCGGGGMSYGMQAAGVRVIAGIDSEKSCQDTYLANIQGAKFINCDVFELSEHKLVEELHVQRNDDNLILIGCSPCQYWSIINTDKKRSEQSKSLLKEFSRFVQYLMPGYVVVENVPGVLRRKKESGLEAFIDWLKAHNYIVHFEIHNTHDFGVPQNRKRFTLIASRIGNEEVSPIKASRKLTVSDVLGESNGFPKVEAGNIDKSSFKHSVANVTPVTLRRLKKVSKDGGDRLGFADDPDLQLPCFIGKDNSFKDTFGRLWWDKPSPTITTKFYSVSNGRFVHPDENRALSLREGATLQSFPKSFEFHGSSMETIARQIGNAVPPEYSRRIALAIIENSNGKL